MNLLQLKGKIGEKNAKHMLRNSEKAEIIYMQGNLNDQPARNKLNPTQVRDCRKFGKRNF
jgi:hypothetical protein